MVMHVREEVWIANQQDLSDLAARIAKFHDEVRREAYDEGLRNGDGKGRARVAHTVQNFDAGNAWEVILRPVFGRK